MFAKANFPPSSAGIRYTTSKPSYVHANVKKHRRSLKFLYIFELLICDYIHFFTVIDMPI